MLTLRRKKYQSLTLKTAAGETITIVVSRSVQLAVSAPESVRIDRTERLESMQNDVVPSACLGV